MAGMTMTRDGRMGRGRVKPRRRRLGLGIGDWGRDQGPLAPKAESPRGAALGGAGPWKTPPAMAQALAGGRAKAPVGPGA
jgi:hypothetical protein